MSTAATRANGVVDGGEPVAVASATVLERGDRRVLTIDHLELRPGEVVAVVGPNGSGKSTLLHALAGLLPPVAGRLDILGRGASAALGRVAYVLQSHHPPEHVPATVGEVVALGRRRGPMRRLSRDDRQAVADALDRLELADLRHRRLGELSGGQRQRVVIAQALVQASPLLLLDEPLAALDLASADRIRTVTREEAAAGRTVVAATHDLADAAAADRVVLLAGRVVASGPPADALTPDTLREAYGERVVHLRESGMLLDDSGHHH